MVCWGFFLISKASVQHIWWVCGFAMWWYFQGCEEKAATNPVYRFSLLCFFLFPELYPSPVFLTFLCKSSSANLCPLEWPKIRNIRVHMKLPAPEAQSFSWVRSCLKKEVLLMLRGDELIMLSVECKLELELSYIWKIITLSPAQPLEVSDISSCLRNEAQRAAQLAIGQLSFWE